MPVSLLKTNILDFVTLSLIYFYSILRLHFCSGNFLHHYNNR